MYLEYLNSESIEIIGVIISFILMLTTIIGSLYAIKMFESATAPNIIPKVRMIGGLAYCLEIKNYGTSTAYKVRFKVSDKFKTSLMENNLKGMAELIEKRELDEYMLTPQQVIILPLTGKNSYEKITKAPLIVSLSYKRKSGKKYKENITIPLYALADALLRDDSEKIATSLGEINKNLAVFLLNYPELQELEKKKKEPPTQEELKSLKELKSLEDLKSLEEYLNRKRQTNL